MLYKWSQNVPFKFPTCSILERDQFLCVNDFPPIHKIWHLTHADGVAHPRTAAQVVPGGPDSHLLPAAQVDRRIAKGRGREKALNFSAN